MNGKDIRPVTVESLQRRTVFSLLTGSTIRLEPGDQLTGFVNEYGNVYTEDEQYVGSLGLAFTEVTA